MSVERIANAAVEAKAAAPQKKPEVKAAESEAKEPAKEVAKVANEEGKGKAVDIEA